MDKLTKDEVILQLANMASGIERTQGESRWAKALREAIRLVDEQSKALSHLIESSSNPPLLVHQDAPWSYPEINLAEDGVRQAYISYKKGFEDGSMGIYSTVEEVSEDAESFAREHAGTTKNGKDG